MANNDLNDSTPQIAQQMVDEARRRAETKKQQEAAKEAQAKADKAKKAANGDDNSILW